MFAMIFLFGYALRICESPLSRNDSESNNLSLYANTMWNIIITMTTVGYGDFYARTDLGRLIIFMVCIFGVFVVSMMVVTLTNSLMATSLEGKAITVLERL
jgi:Ion channel